MEEQKTYLIFKEKPHHLEEKVIDGDIAENERYVLSPEGREQPHPTEEKQTIKTFDRLVIGGREIRFSDMAEWLLEMQKVADKIV